MTNVTIALPDDIKHSLRMTSIHQSTTIDKVIENIIKQYYNTRNED